MNQLLQSLSIRSWWNATGRRTTRTFLLGVLFIPGSWVALTFIKWLPGFLESNPGWFWGALLGIMTILVCVSIFRALVQREQDER